MAYPSLYRSHDIFIRQDVSPNGEPRRRLMNGSPEVGEYRGVT